MRKLTETLSLKIAVQRLASTIASVAQAAADDISALQTSLSERPTTAQVEEMISEAIAAHNETDESHPNHLVVR